MTPIPLRTLEAELSKLVIVVSTERDEKGLYVWRGSDGQAYKWGPSDKSYEFHPVATVAEADELTFLCPLCFEKNGGAAGTHSVFVTFAGRNVPDEAGSRDHTGKPSRWNASGRTVDDLVLTPSIALDASRPADKGCHWHGFVGSSGVPPGHAG